MIDGMISIGRFRTLVWGYYRAHGRDLAWRRTKNPYRILVSEIMLQQTQVSRVAPFYEKFIKQFPTFRALAEARTADVLHAWQGLGYNRRALALQKIAAMVVRDHNGKLPNDRGVLEALPGIGRGTSGSLLAFIFNEPVVFIETNIRRAFIYHFFPNRENVSDAELEPLIEKALDRRRPREWYYALMDYGAMLGEKSRARSGSNPNARSRHYARQSKFAGSDRELRGRLLRLFLKEKKIAAASLPRKLAEPSARVTRVANGLARDGFLERKGKWLAISG